MLGEVSKSDWKHFKTVRELALERLCDRILDSVRDTASDKSQNSHERFLSIFKLVNESNQDIARGFDHLSRSRMIQQLGAMQSMQLLEQSEIDRFSEDLRERLATMAKLLR